MPARSAGILLYRRLTNGQPEVLLAHPGGPFWRNKDLGAWQVPKGLMAAGEDEEAAARREVEEELGIDIKSSLEPLGEIRQSGGKTVIAFAAEQDFDPALVVSNTVEIEWPPRSGHNLTIPEIDEARWFTFDDARRYMLASQVPLLDGLVTKLNDQN
jgi:predicted NUDIX family NTP pyrophosphohydrolase